MAMHIVIFKLQLIRNVRVRTFFRLMNPYKEVKIVSQYVMYILFCLSSGERFLQT